MTPKIEPTGPQIIAAALIFTALMMLAIDRAAAIYPNV